jgi:hypothetical protein
VKGNVVTKASSSSFSPLVIVVKWLIKREKNLPFTLHKFYGKKNKKITIFPLSVTMYEISFFFGAEITWGLESPKI